MTSTELVERVLASIEATQPTLNAFRALAADERLERGERLPLLGVPVAVKDDVDVAGEPTSFGCSGQFPRARADSEMVRRLRAAGAIVVGKTNTPEVGLYPFTEGDAFGATRNPWSLGHTPGGSSGGSAAAVAGFEVTTSARMCGLQYPPVSGRATAARLHARRKNQGFETKKRRATDGQRAGGRPARNVSPALGAGGT